MSCTTIASSGAAAKSSAVRAQIAGWVMASRSRRAALSPKTIRPNPARSRIPSSETTLGPNRSRIAAQADDDARRAAADVLLDNNGSPEDLATAVDALWQSRIVPFAEALRSGTRSRAATSAQSPPDPTWPAQAARLLARIGHALGDRVVALEHIGSTAVPDLPAKDVIDLQVGVRDLTEADGAAFVADLASAGFVRVPGVDHDNAKDGGTWPKRLHGSVDPGRVAHVHVRAVGSPGWDWAIDVRDWLRADPEARDAYAAAKAALAARHTDSGDYADAKEAWFDGADDRLRTWRAARQS